MDPSFASDQLTAYYADLLDATYDCPDRIVLNAYHRFICSPGGFRLWWRRLYGHDDNLSNSTLQRISGRFSRRLRRWAECNDIPAIYTNSGEKKHLIADRYLPEDPAFTGVFLIIIGRAPGLIFKVDRSDNGQIRNIETRKTQTYVNHYSFHVIDPDWGHLCFKICGQPPFAAQINLNGHEYVARQALKKGVTFTKEGNCFTSASSGADLARVAETLRSPNAVGQLAKVCDRWIYSLLCFALTSEEQQRTTFTYEYSVYQVEYSRNLLFSRGTDLERVAQGMIDHTRAHLDVRTVKTIFGLKRRPHFRHPRGTPPRFENVVERPAYDLTVFKLHFGKLTLKVYTKGARVLRIEAIIHNVKSFHSLRRSLGAFPDILNALLGMVDRFLDVLVCVDVPSISAHTWDDLPRPSRLGDCRVPGVDLSKPRIRAAIAAVIALAVKPDGFTVREMAEKVNEATETSGEHYARWSAAYDLRKLRAKGFVARVPRSHRYLCTTDGLKAMVALVVILDRVLRPVLAGAGKPRRGPKPKAQAPANTHYESLQREMRNLFETLGIAA